LAIMTQYDSRIGIIFLLMSHSNST
jgi:hypothetical protein